MDRAKVVLLAVLSSSLPMGCPAKETSRTKPATQAAPKQKLVKPTGATAGPGLKRLTISPTQCSTWRLPPTAFSFTYPAKADLSLAKAGRRNPYYALVEIYRDKKISEGVSISHVDLKGGPAAKWDLLGPVAMKRLQTAMQRQLAGIKIVSSGKASFGGKDVYQFRFEFEITDTRRGDLGKYRAVWVALVSHPLGTHQEDKLQGSWDETTQHTGSLPHLATPDAIQNLET